MLAGERRQVAATRAPARGPGRSRARPWRSATRAGAAGERGGTGAVEVVAGDEDPRGGGPDRVGRRLHRDEGALLDALLDGDAAGEPSGDQGGAGLGGAQREDVADLRVRRAGLVEEVVAVVPPGDQPEVVERREGGRARPDDAAHVAAQDLQPGRVASLWTLVGGQPDVLARAEESGQRAVDAVDVAMVRDDDEGPATGGHRGRRGDGERGRPVLLGRAARQGEPRGGRALTGRDAAQQGLAGGVCGPRSRFGSGDQGGRGGAGLVERAFGGGVALGDGQPQHVAEDAGVAVGDGAGRGPGPRG